MQVLGTHELCGGLAPPLWLGALLVQTCVDAYKVDEVEVDRLSRLVDGPCDVDAAAFVIIRGGIGIIREVGQVVGIAIAEADEHVVVGAPPAVYLVGEVIHIIWQACAAEGEAVGEPLGVVLLGVVVVAVDGAALSEIVCPRDIAHGILMIGDLIVVDHLPHAVCVARAADLVPGVVRQAVAVGIFRHHHDACLVHAAKDEVLHLLIGIAPDGEVALAWDVGDGVVEMEGDIASPSSEGHEMCVEGSEARHVLVTLAEHVGLRVALLIFWGVVDELSWCGAVLVDGLDVFRMLRDVGQALGT